MEQIFLESAEHAVDAIKSNTRVRPVGAGTKPALVQAVANQTFLNCCGLNGLLEYEPTEFTFTARSGTPIKKIQEELEANSQFLPFDPPFANQGATIGGAIAAGLNGSCSLRYGGARDFILGIRFVDGLGNHVMAGGKVVKNAAGFDLPKFMVGSYGLFGLLTELTLKVFPRPELQETLIFEDSLASLIDSVKRLILTPLELDAVDLTSRQLVVRLGGSSETIASARDRIQELVGKPCHARMTEKEDSEYWDSMNRFLWHENEEDELIKIPCQINHLESLVQIAEKANARFRISIGGQVIYFAVEPDSVACVRRDVEQLGFDSISIRGKSSDNSLPRGGLWSSIQRALDPELRFQAD